MTNKIFWSFLISAGFFLLSETAQAKVQDSIGTKVRNGKVYIIHEVDKGQGAFTVAKRYGISIETLNKENPGIDKGLIIGQLLYIPTGKQAPFEEPVVKEYFSGDKKKQEIKTSAQKVEEKATFAQYHTVVAGETLFSISQQYKTSVEIIKELNGLTSNELSLGTKLMVPAQNEGEVVKADVKEKKVEAPKEVLIETKKTKEIEEIKSKNNKEKAVVEQNTVVTETANYNKKVENLPEFGVEKVTETGSAISLVADQVNQNKNLAYHHEAQENTIIMVTNLANKKAVFVKVVGSFSLDPSKGEVIKLSKAAMDQIGLGSKGQVEISYAR